MYLLEKRVRKDVALGNGFRKYAISCFVRAKVNHEVRQMLVDHKGGYLDESYLRLRVRDIGRIYEGRTLFDGRPERKTSQRE
jgi:hypothetical protein